MRAKKTPHPLAQVRSLHLTPDGWLRLETANGESVSARLDLAQEPDLLAAAVGLLGVSRAPAGRSPRSFHASEGLLCARLGGVIPEHVCTTCPKAPLGSGCQEG